MRCIVVGPEGLLGSAVVDRLKRDSEMTVVPLPHRNMDITVISDVLRALRSLKPDAIINCAAYTDVERCESEESLASAVNGAGVFNLGMAAQMQGSYFLHMSTDYVFDGKLPRPYRESDPVCPINAYGRTKLEGEETLVYLINEKDLQCAVVRTSWLFGPHPTKKDFVARVAGTLQSNHYAFGVLNEFGCPTYSYDLADVLVEMVKKRQQGTYHCCNAGGFISRLELVETIAARFGGKVHPVTAQDAAELFSLKARRPLLSALCCDKMKADMNMEMRHWKQAVTDRFRQLLSHTKG